ncbi:LysR family transcriptional regulator [Arenicella sp. 4NH20-0111]|uniref:LysR family transcriptional regulator n=1 Tax=Arenicella sp. 4NH20-0111 TaxID=3127648 RepID=UPI003101FCFD
MNIDSIKLFIAVYSAGSFAAVARTRNLAPSTVSRSIAFLERDLNIRLFQRNTRNLTPTQEGHNYFSQIVPLIEEIELAHRSLRQSMIKPSGRLTVSASTSYGQIVIAPMLVEFRKRFPEVELNFRLSDNRVDLVGEQVDVAIRHGVLEESSMIARKIATVNYRLVASASYLAHSEPIRCPQDLTNHELVAFDYPDFRHIWQFRSNMGVQKLAVNPALVTNSAAAIRQCVHDGFGIALLADWTVDEDLHSGKLVHVLPTWKASGASEESAIWLLYSSKKFLPAKTRAFIEFLSGEP